MFSDFEININFLIRKYVSGILTDDEARLLAEWVESSEQNARYFRTMCHSFEKQLPETVEAEDFWCRMNRQPQSSTQNTSSSRRAIRAISAIAAAMSIVAAVLFFGLNHPEVVVEIPVIAEQSTVVEPSTETSAVVAQAVHYKTSANEHKHITLPDGTKIILNSNSRLTQCAGFNETERNVELCGEAYFDVAKSAKRFTVHTSDKSYIVHGTSFNIFDFDDRRNSIITLHTGKLEARVKESAYILLPGEELRVDDTSNSISKHTVDIENSIGWLNKELKFSRLPLKFVANKLSHKYGVKINIHNSIENITYTGKLHDEDIDTALRLISVTAPIKIAVNEFDGEYYISKRE